MEYNLFLTNTQSYQIIGYNGNGSKGYVRYAVDWTAFLKRDCPYILTIVLRSRRVERQNGDFMLLATGLLGENIQSGVQTSKQSSQLIGIIKQHNGSKIIGGVLNAYISYGNGFKTYLPRRPASPFFDIEILTIDGLPIVVAPHPFDYNLIMNFKEVNTDIPLTINPKTYQLTFYSDNALNAPIPVLGTTAIFNVDWSFLDEKPYLMRFSFFSQTHAGTPIAQSCHFCNIPTLNTISNQLFTGSKIMNQNTSLIGISKQRSYHDDGQGFFHSEFDDNPPSTILTRPKSNRLEWYNTGFQLNLRSTTPIQYRFILSFTEL